MAGKNVKAVGCGETKPSVRSQSSRYQNAECDIPCETDCEVDCHLNSDKGEDSRERSGRNSDRSSRSITSKSRGTSRSPSKNRGSKDTGSRNMKTTMKARAEESETDESGNESSDISCHCSDDDADASHTSAEEDQEPEQNDGEEEQDESSAKKCGCQPSCRPNQTEGQAASIPPGCKPWNVLYPCQFRCPSMDCGRCCPLSPCFPPACIYQQPQQPPSQTEKPLEQLKEASCKCSSKQEEPKSPAPCCKCSSKQSENDEATRNGGGNKKKPCTCGKKVDKKDKKETIENKKKSETKAVKKPPSIKVIACNQSCNKCSDKSPSVRSNKSSKSPTRSDKNLKTKR